MIFFLYKLKWSIKWGGLFQHFCSNKSQIMSTTQISPHLKKVKTNYMVVTSLGGRNLDCLELLASPKLTLCLNSRLSVYVLNCYTSYITMHSPILCYSKCLAVSLYRAEIHCLSKKGQLNQLTWLFHLSMEPEERCIFVLNIRNVTKLLSAQSGQRLT